MSRTFLDLLLRPVLPTRIQIFSPSRQVIQDCLARPPLLASRSPYSRDSSLMTADFPGVRAENRRRYPVANRVNQPVQLHSSPKLPLNYLSTLPEPPPPASFSTSSAETRLKSPGIVCFRQDAATANSSAFFELVFVSRP